jgi:hypothetical protein
MDGRKGEMTRKEVILLVKKASNQRPNKIQEDTMVEDMGKSIPRIYAVLEDRQEKHQSHMIEVEDKIINKPGAILIYSGEINSYIDPKIVNKFHLDKSKLEKTSLVQLATRTKRRINESVIGFQIIFNGVSINADLNIIPWDIIIS